MKKDLFLVRNLPKRRMTSISSLFSVFFVLLFSSLSFASTLSQKDSVATKQNSVIYVLGNTIIKGESSFSNANIIIVETVEKKSSNTKQNTVEKKEDQSISAQISKKEKERLARIQKKVKEKPTTFLAKNQTSSDFNNINSQNGSIAVASSNSYSPFKFLKVFLQEDKALVHCEDKKNKQKFYATLSYLHFGKYRSSSLRAPPVFV